MSLNNDSRGSFWRWLERLSFVLVAAAALAVIYRVAVSSPASTPPPPPPPSRPEPALPSAPIDVAQLWTIGNPTATVALLVLADFECPSCGRFAREATPEIEKRFVDTGRIRMMFGHFPLPRHSRAVPAAVAAECAGQASHFWEMHRELFSHQTSLDAATFLKTAGSIGVPSQAFEKCLADEAVAKKIRAQAEQLRSLDVRGTPTLLLGRLQVSGRLQVIKRWTGGLSAEFISSEIEQLLDKRTN